jgi:hypothetical protein
MIDVVYINDATLSSYKVLSNIGRITCNWNDGQKYYLVQNEIGECYKNGFWECKFNYVLEEILYLYLLKTYNFIQADFKTKDKRERLNVQKILGIDN